MSYPKVYNWPAPDTQAISLTQTVGNPFGGGGNFIINGHLTINSIQPGNAIFPGISRSVSLTSANNLSAKNFTITGILNEKIVSETIAGPNNNTVETTQLYDIVTNVSVDAFSSSVSVGSGTIGRTHWFNYDYNRSISNTVVQTLVTGTINYTFNITLDNVELLEPNELFHPIANLTNATTNQLEELNSIIFNFAHVQINSSTDGTLVVTIMQGGIT